MTSNCNKMFIIFTYTLYLHVLILSNFASRITAVNQTVQVFQIIIKKNYFCELASVFNSKSFKSMQNYSLDSLGQ